MKTVTGLVLLALGGAAAFAARSGTPAAPVEISSVEVGLTEGGPVVLLKARGRSVPIFVDPVVAGSIHDALRGNTPPRPMSHDLMKTILEAYGAKVTRVSITLKGSTFYADLSIARADGSVTVFDSRSSDAIALAVRFKAPILVGEDLLESSGQRIPGPGEQML